MGDIPTDPVLARSRSDGMGQRIREFNWSNSYLGPRERWPISLRFAVDLLLAQPLPMILLWGPDLIQIYNDAYAVIAGSKHPAALGRATRESWPEVWHINAPIFDRVMRLGESVLLQDQLFPITRHGALEEAYFDVAYGPVRSDAARVAGVMVTVAETTQKVVAVQERERLLLDVRAERSNLEAVILQAPAFMCVLRGPEHVFSLANERYYDVVGRRDILGKPVREALPELEGQGFFELLDRVYATGDPYVGSEVQVDIRRNEEGGSPDRLFVNFTYQALRAADGGVAGIVVHGVDVTDLVRSREAVRASEHQRRLALDSAELGAWHVDPATMTLMTDARFRALFGVAADEPLEYEAAVALIHPDDREHVEQAVAAATRRGDPAPYVAEYRVVQPDGSVRWVFAKGRANFGGEGSSRRLVSFDGTLADVTDRRAADAERQGLLTRERAARAEADAASRAKDQFLAVLSHELRTPLAPVVMTLAALEDREDLPHDVREEIAMVRRNVDLETRLIDDLLDLSRVISGKLRLHPKPTHLHAVLRHAYEVCASDLNGKHLTPKFDLRATNDRVIGDPARLQQVFWNLLKNAIKFSPDRKVIDIRSSNAGHDKMRVEIQDHGIGIAPDALTRIFGAFEQAESGTTHKFGGLGLGLAISQAVVDMHGGTIRATSAGPGTGATFTVELTTTADTVAAPASAESFTGATHSGRAMCRVLLVEDHPDTARVMTRLLELAGYVIRVAHSVASALQLAAAEPFDLVVSDIGLPDDTGYSLMQQLASRYGMKGIAMTGYGMEDDVRRGVEAGFVDHVVKPVSLPHLVNVMERVLRP